MQVLKIAVGEVSKHVEFWLLIPEIHLNCGNEVYIWIVYFYCPVELPSLKCAFNVYFFIIILIKIKLGNLTCHPCFQVVYCKANSLNSTIERQCTHVFNL